MADRVAFFTLQDNVTSSNTSGCNGFSFPFTQSTSDAQHPVAVSLADCDEIYWRIKNWKSATDITINDGLGGTYTVPSGTMTIGGANATTELDLEQPTVHSFSIVTGSDSQALSVIGSINQDSGTLYPQIEFSYEFPFTAKVSFDPTPPLNYVAAGSCPATVKGYSLTAYFFLFSPLVPGYTMSGTFLDFTGQEWWPYATLGGLPVWDTTTGAQLQDPRS